VNLAVAAATFPVVALGELPDKTMFASLLLASRGRPVSVWLGVALAFTVHVAIAVTIGVAVFDLLPHRILAVVVALLFLAGAAWSWFTRGAAVEDVRVVATRSPWRSFAAAASVIFLAEWGDLTQVITADLAARYHAPLSVGVGALVGLLLVAAVAVAGGSGLLRRLPVRTLRIATAVVLAGLGGYALAVALGA
jgi:putative Ca2+/H+ antiporter (TMEM165/GDT1 family)